MGIKIPSDKSKGDKLSAADVNAYNQTARMVLGTTGANGISVSVTNSGVTIKGNQTRTFEQPAVKAAALNISDEELNRGEVVQLTYPLQTQTFVEPYGDLHSGSPQQGSGFRQQQIIRPEVFIPETNCFGRFAIVREKIRPHSTGEVFVDGICACYILRGDDYDTSRTYGKPDRADIVAGTRYLQVNEIGSAQVLWIDRPMSPPMDQLRMCIFKFDHRNTNGVGITDFGNEKNDGVAEVIQLNDALTVTELKSGIIQIDKA